MSGRVPPPLPVISFAFDALIDGDPVPNGIDPAIWRPVRKRMVEGTSAAIRFPRFCRNHLTDLLRHHELARVVSSRRTVDAPPESRLYPFGLQPHYGAFDILLAHFRARVAPRLRRDLLLDSDLLLLDGSSELVTPMLVKSILAMLAEASVPGDRVVCAHANFHLPPGARGGGIRFLRYHYALAQSARCFGRRIGDRERFVDAKEIAQSTAAGQPRRRWYLSLNGSLRRHRLFLALGLLRSGHLGKGFVSFPSVDRRSFDRCLTVPGPLDPNEGAAACLLPFLDELIARLPLEVDQAQRLRVAPFGLPRIVIDPYDDMAAWPYRQSYFSIVTETEFCTGSGARFTEKICKPMVNLHPFVLVGSPGTLAELRRLGFQTFESFINESYDAIRDPWTRLEAVFRQIDALCGLSLRQLDEWYRALLPRLLHNRRHLFVQARREASGLHGRLASLLAKAPR